MNASSQTSLLSFSRLVLLAVASYELQLASPHNSEGERE